MSDCCSSSAGPAASRDASRKSPCPSCGALAAAVSLTTLRHNLHAPALLSLPEAPCYFCADSACSVVYFSPEGDVFDRTQVRAVGYEKTSDLDDLVCHCFDVSGRRIADEWQAGNSRSRAFIVEQTREKRCACEARNPSGRCCLKAIGGIEAGLDADPAVSGVRRLVALLPLAERLAQASPLAQQAYGRILERLRTRGLPVAAVDLREYDTVQFRQVVDELAAADLVVADADHARVLGAYPLTTETTDHRLEVDGVPLFAMCAVDALAVAPVTGSRVLIDSRCAVSGTVVRIQQDGDTLDLAEPAGVQVGIAWQDTGGCAAHSLCRDMVFLCDAPTAAQWRDTGDGMRDIYDLSQALALARQFFLPLTIEPGQTTATP